MYSVVLKLACMIGVSLHEQAPHAMAGYMCLFVSVAAWMDGYMCTIKINTCIGALKTFKSGTRMYRMNTEPSKSSSNLFS